MTIQIDDWSWTGLVKAMGGDEDKAFDVLEQMPGLGQFSDEVHHQPTRGRDPVVIFNREVPRDTCPEGHPLTVKNGFYPNGTQRWLCGPCTNARKRASESRRVGASSTGKKSEGASE